MFPTKFILESDAKKDNWQFLAIVPPVDPHRVMRAVDSLNLPVDFLNKYNSQKMLSIDVTDTGGKVVEQMSMRQQINQVVYGNPRGRGGRGKGNQGIRSGGTLEPIKRLPPRGKLLGEEKTKSFSRQPREPSAVASRPRGRFVPRGSFRGRGGSNRQEGRGRGSQEMRDNRGGGNTGENIRQEVWNKRQPLI